MSTLGSWFACGAGFDAVSRVHKAPSTLSHLHFWSSRKGPIMEEPSVLTPKNEEDRARVVGHRQYGEPELSPSTPSPEELEISYLDEEVELDAAQEEFDLQVRRMCVRLVRGWDLLDPSSIAIYKISGGITNILVKAIALGEDGIEVVPPVAVRVFGPNTDIVIDRQREFKVLKYLSVAGFGAKLLGAFKNGFIQSFIYARTLEPCDMSKTEMVPKIAEEVRRFHQVDIPEPRVPQLWVDLHKFFQIACSISFDDPVKQVRYSTVNFAELLRQLQEMETLCHSLNAPIVLCHNDLLSGNFMYNDTTAELHIIDFEYGAYNYRGYDIGNHFNEYAGFDCDFTLFPTREQQYLFFWHYLKPERQALVQRHAPDLNLEAFLDDGKKRCMPCVSNHTAARLTENLASEMERLYVETNVFALTSHLYWSLWAIVQARYSPIEFDYLNYFFLRYDEYKNRKADVIALVHEYRESVHSI